jgi:toxin HigB-1
MIKSFRDGETETVFGRRFSRRLPTDIQSAALRKLRMLSNAVNLNDQWRICFSWREGDAFDVEITDHH